MDAAPCLSMQLLLRSVAPRSLQSIQSKAALRIIVILLLPVLVEAKKKSKFLAGYPSIFKFLLFWWCVIVFAIMFVYIVDQLFYKFRGPCRIDFDVECKFRGVADRLVYWEQVMDPTKWKETHPILQSADVRLVECTGLETKDTDEAAGQSASEAETDTAGTRQPDDAVQNVGDPPNTKLTPVPLGPLKEGLGLILRHKTGSGPREGTFFCTRKCIQLDMPKEGDWRLVMRTVEVGGGYPFLPDTEQSELIMSPPAEDGSITCQMYGYASVSSRFFGWWTGLRKASEQGAAMMLEAIGEEIERGKKDK